MAYDNSNNDRQMYQGNWSCSSCGSQITELPFEPDPNRLDQLTCRDCHKKNRPQRSNSNNNDQFERKMHRGNWTCSQCGSQITELPFEPSSDRLHELTCRDCHRNNR